MKELTEEQIDARRYQRLRILGARPYRDIMTDPGSLTDSGLMLRFTNLDEFVDRDIEQVPHRGEVKYPALAPPQLSGDVVEAMLQKFYGYRKEWGTGDVSDMTAAAQTLLKRMRTALDAEIMAECQDGNWTHTQIERIKIRIDSAFNSLLKLAEPLVPEEIKALLLDTDAPAESRPTRNFYNFNVLEAFKRGQKSGAGHDR